MTANPLRRLSRKYNGEFILGTARFQISNPYTLQQLQKTAKRSGINLREVESRSDGIVTTHEMLASFLS